MYLQDTVPFGDVRETSLPSSSPLFPLRTVGNPLYLNE
jgi:hypothetical protein